MRAVVQRVKRAAVRVNGGVVGSIGPGLLVLVGIGKTDSDTDLQNLAEKIVNLRVFEDEHGKMNRSLLERGGQVLCVSQFTLYGDCRKGRRPSYDQAAGPDTAQRLYDDFVKALRSFGIVVATGQFQAMMEVELVNDGPVTLLLDSEKKF
jgi:D-tyrosyl-tRNA(Tyr) deacylase